MPLVNTPEADAHEGQTVAVRRVHVGLNLEDETGEIRVVRRHRPHVASCEAGGVEYSRKRVRNGSTPKLVMAEPKNIGVSSPFAHKIQIEGIARDIQQLDFIHQALVEALAEQLRKLRIV